MVFDFFKKLLMSRQLTFERGQIKIAGETSIMVHGPALVRLTDTLIKIMGKKGINYIYLSSKEGGKSLGDAYKKKFLIKEVKLANLLKDLAEMGGWGEFSFIKIDSSNRSLICNVNKSPFAELTILKGKKVCHMIRGFLAGGASVGFNEDLDCIETKCVAEGSSFCEFFIKTKKNFKEKKLVKEQLT